MPESDQCYSPGPLDANSDSRPGWVDLPDSTQWAVNLDGGGFRLLTEAEWEYVCRSGVGTGYSFGNDRDLLGNYCWFQDNSQEWLHPVAQLRPNPRGLFDIHGNVYEWCHDWYSSEIADDNEDPIGAEVDSFRVIRGGSWSSAAGYCRAGFRSRSLPTIRDCDLGFRVALFRWQVPAKKRVATA